MIWNLRCIEAIQSDEYSVMFDVENGMTKRILCRVFVHEGIPAVQPEPDVFMTSDVNARAIAAAVLAFHDART